MKRNLLIALALIAVLFLGGWSLQAAKTQQWEFKTITIKTHAEVGYESQEIDTILDNMGGAGWELASSETVKHGEFSDLTRFYFKRLK
jgi:hypothetical protein